MATTVTIGGGGSLFVGEDKTFRLGVQTVVAPIIPIDISTWSILFDVRVKDSATTAIFSKTASIQGTFNASPALNTQRAVVTLTDDEMNTVKAKAYRHSWKRMDDGSETVLARGNFVVEKATAP